MLITKDGLVLSPDYCAPGQVPKSKKEEFNLDTGPGRLVSDEGNPAQHGCYETDEG